jgi:hypothetical protein
MVMEDLVDKDETLLRIQSQLSIMYVPSSNRFFRAAGKYCSIIVRSTP